MICSRGIEKIEDPSAAHGCEEHLRCFHEKCVLKCPADSKYNPDFGHACECNDPAKHFDLKVKKCMVCPKGQTWVELIDKNGKKWGNCKIDGALKAKA